MAKSISYKKYLLQRLKDPREAAAYINASIEDGDAEVLLLTLRDVAEAQGGIGDLAKKTELNRESLYRSLSGRGNPTLKGMRTILQGLGLCLSVSPIQISSSV